MTYGKTMKYFSLCIIFLFTGCSVSIVADASEDKRYSKIINKTYRTTQPLKVMANVVDDFKSKVILSYTIGKAPGYANRYVLWIKKIPKGTIIRTTGTVQYNSLFGSSSILTIDDINHIFKRYKNAPIGIDVSLTKLTKDKKYIMNQEYFEEIE